MGGDTLVKATLKPLRKNGASLVSLSVAPKISGREWDQIFSRWYCCARNTCKSLLHCCVTLFTIHNINNDALLSNKIFYLLPLYKKSVRLAALWANYQSYIREVAIFLHVMENLQLKMWTVTKIWSAVKQFMHSVHQTDTQKKNTGVLRGSGGGGHLQQYWW